LKTLLGLLDSSTTSIRSSLMISRFFWKKSVRKPSDLGTLSFFINKWANWTSETEWISGLLSSITSEGIRDMSATWFLPDQISQWGIMRQECIFVFLLINFFFLNQAFKWNSACLLISSWSSQSLPSESKRCLFLLSCPEKFLQLESKWNRSQTVSNLKRKNWVYVLETWNIVFYFSITMFDVLLQSEYPKHIPLLAQILEGLVTMSSNEDKKRHEKEVFSIMFINLWRICRKIVITIT